MRKTFILLLCFLMASFPAVAQATSTSYWNSIQINTNTGYVKPLLSGAIPYIFSNQVTAAGGLKAYAFSGTALALDAAVWKLHDGMGVKSANWSDRYLYAADGTNATLNWNLRQLYGTWQVNDGLTGYDIATTNWVLNFVSNLLSGVAYQAGTNNFTAPTNTFKAVVAETMTAAGVNISDGYGGIEAYFQKTNDTTRLWLSSSDIAGSTKFGAAIALSGTNYSIPEVRGSLALMGGGCDLPNATVSLGEILFMVDGGYDWITNVGATGWVTKIGTDGNWSFGNHSLSGVSSVQASGAVTAGEYNGVNGLRIYDEDAVHFMLSDHTAMAFAMHDAGGLLGPKIVMFTNNVSGSYPKIELNARGKTTLINGVITFQTMGSVSGTVETNGSWNFNSKNLANINHTVAKTNFSFYVSATNWAGSWQTYAGSFHGINSNGTIRTITNLWGW